MTSGQHVLVVDGLSETEEVLRAVLEPRGFSVDRIRRNGPQTPPSTKNPHVVVLHEEDGPECEPRPDGWEHVPRVIIGAARVAASDEGHEYLHKPFCYGELIRAIERLLDSKDAVRS